MNQLVLERREGPLLVLTLNDPERANPLSPAMAERLTEALTEAEEDALIRAVVLTGSGRHFSAGADLAALRRVADGGDEAANVTESERLERLFGCLLGLSKLSLAAVSGAAVAGGCGLATACDFVVADATARFCYTEVKIGFIPALVSTFLSRRVPGHVARRLMLDPEMLDADQATEIGLADEVVEEGAALARSMQWAESILRKASPAAVAATKRLMNETVGMAWRDALGVAAAANAGQRMHPECRHGVSTFLEHKTTPDWLEVDREEEADS